MSVEKCVFEINKSQLKIIKGVADSDKGRVKVIDYYEKNFNEPLITDESKIDTVTLQLELKEIIKSKKLNCKNGVNIVLSGMANILIRELELPYADDEQMYQLIRNEARQYFPVNVDNFVFDYKDISVIDDDENDKKGKNKGNKLAKKRKVLIIGVSKLLIEGIVASCKSLGIKISKIDIESNALSKLFVYSFEEKNSSPFMIANITRNGLSVSVVENGNLVISKLFYIPQIEYMFQENSEDVEYTDVEESLVDCIEKFYDFVRTKDKPISGIKNVYLTGEITQYIDITPYLKKRTGLEPIFVKELKKVSVKADNVAMVVNTFCVPIGGLL